MASLVTRIVNKLLSRPPVSPADELIRQGHLRVGQSCDLSAMSVFIPDKVPGNLNIEIGDNCCIRGSLVLYRKTSKIRIGNNVYIGPGTLLECVEEIEIGNDVLISTNCNIIDTNSHSVHSQERIADTVDWQKGLAHKNWDVVDSRKISIGNHCWLGLRSILLKGVSLAEGTIVAAGSVVTKSTEAFTVVAGNPAQFIRKAD